MQFSSDIEKCLENKWELRKIPKPRRLEILKFLHIFRRNWHILRAKNCLGLYYPDSIKWLQKRDNYK